MPRLTSILLCYRSVKAYLWSKDFQEWMALQGSSDKVGPLRENALIYNVQFLALNQETFMCNVQFLALNQGTFMRPSLRPETHTFSLVNKIHLPYKLFLWFFYIDQHFNTYVLCWWYTNVLEPPSTNIVYYNLWLFALFSTILLQQ